MVESKEQDVSHKDTECVVTLSLLCCSDGIRREELMGTSDASPLQSSVWLSKDILLTLRGKLSYIMVLLPCHPFCLARQSASTLN